MKLLAQFLNDKDILIKKESNEISPKFNGEKDILQQIGVICEFQKRVMNGEGAFFLKLENSIGKGYESYKASLKRFKRAYFKLKIKGAESEFEKALLEYGDEVIKRGERALLNIKYDEYIYIIKRSMKRSEICIGNVLKDNIWMNDKIYIKDVSNISLNLIENDMINILLKIKKKKANFNIDNFINYYIKEQNLDYRSENYIKNMILFPTEFLKCYNKKIMGKRDWDDQLSLKKIILAYENDGRYITY